MTWPTVVTALYLGILGVLCLHGVHRVWLLWRYRRPSTEGPPRVEEWPVVTVQLPLFNERAVSQRIIEAAGALDYPADRLEIQVLDDSTDDTTALARAAVEVLVRKGLDAKVLHRDDRTGFKAGALAAGLEVARGDILAIFDADFVPGPSFLREMVPWMERDVGMVQARWGHLNDRDSWLTEVQATLLDGHFVIEHATRQRTGRWFNFNGTAGLWRRQAILDAGGWQHDTLTEDLDLSYRAQLAGWRFVFRSDAVAPAELPPTMAAFKTQQHRWAKGSIQTARKLLRTIWSAQASWPVKLEATVHLTANFNYPLVLLLSVLLPISILARQQGMARLWFLDALIVILAVVPFAVFYAVAIRDSGNARFGRWSRLPLVFALGIGLAVAQTRAVAEGLLGPVGTFVRTPKRGRSVLPSYRASVHPFVLLEVALAVYLWLAVVWVVSAGHLVSLPFLLLFALGYATVSLQSLRDGVLDGA